MKITDRGASCEDCTPGYVCLGMTNTDKPISIQDNNGYRCPAGYYCPLGSYEEKPCPLGTFNKNKGKKSIEECLPCLEGYYNDLIGQSGCKKCGPTSYSSEGSVTC